MSEEKLSVELEPGNQQASLNINSEHGTFVGWVKKHKKGIIIGSTITTVGIVGGILIGGNWDAITDGAQALISKSKNRSVVTKTPQILVAAVVPVDEITKHVDTDKGRSLLNAGEEFNIRRHPRTLPIGKKASQSKISQAAILGIPLSEHQTWVETYKKNCA